MLPAQCPATAARYVEVGQHEMGRPASSVIAESVARSAAAASQAVTAV
jgi:hypothetical protein